MLNVSIELARGLAALWVFMFHIQGSIEAASPLLGALAAYGHLGVPMFFVISGYCLYASASGSLVPGRRNAFLKRRLLRIYPPFWAAILVAVASPFIIEALSSLKSGTFVFPSPRWMTEFGFSEWLQVVSLTRVFWNDGGDLQAAFNPVNAVFWSLAIELQFYIVVYASLWFGRNWLKALTAVFVLSLVSLAIPTIRESGLFLPYWPAFALGLLLRHLYVTNRSPQGMLGKKSLSVSVVAIVTICAVFAVVVGLHPDPVPTSLDGYILYRFLPFALVVGVALWFVGEIERALTRFEFSGPLLLLRYGLQPFLLAGACSYSLYLIHGRIYPITEMFVRRLVSHGSLLYPLLTISGTVVVAYLFYLAVERPFMSGSYKARVKAVTHAEREHAIRTS